MSTEERNLATNKYWTNVDGERYLQVEEIDDSCFRCGDDDADADDDDEGNGADEPDAKKHEDSNHVEQL